MRKLFILLGVVIIFSSILSVTSAASNMTGGSIGETIEFENVDELLEYIENKLWKNEWWYDSLREYTKIDYLKSMSGELFLPIGYVEEDIKK